VIQSDIEREVVGLVQTCLCHAWDDLPVDQRPGRCEIVPGNEVAADDCCDGQAWVRWIRTYRSSLDVFPTEPEQQLSPGQAGCDDLFWAVDMGVGVLRCAPSVTVVGSSYEPPSPEDQTDASLALFDDVARVRSAIMCCVADALEARGWGETSLHVGSTVSQGPAGQCVGFEMSVVIGVFACPCPDV
jgi:hypothetical protein